MLSRNSCCAAILGALLTLVMTSCGGGGSSTGSPSGLKATAVSFEQVDLTWTDEADGEDGYYIERRDKNDATGSFLVAGKAAANAKAYSDKAATEDSTLVYRVSAYSGKSKGDPSGTADVTTSAHVFPDLAAITANIVSLHNYKGQAATPDCFQCHGHMMYRKTLNPVIKEIHARMIPATPGYDKTKYGWDGLDTKVCTHCHQNVDQIEHSGAGARKQVSTATCAACHGPTPAEGTKTLFLSAP
ncbi:MAG: fibronectin type III domain-containing protein [Nitrospirae bacterium]|nr:fibronectin type III domain-containing protein [Nitrospirota bacterium]